jgi:16S rRNA (cytosine967-C5)-methyltransferase
MFLDAAEAREADRLDALPPSDRKLAYRLTRETLRRLGQIDAMIDERLSDPLPEDAAPVRHALRIATAETRFLASKPHAAVDNAVSLAHRAAPRMAGLVNAVSRRIAEGAEADGGLAGASDTPESALALNTPAWLRERLVADWGAETAGAIALAHLAEAPLDLTPRAPDALAAQALAASVGGEPLPTGSVRLSSPGSVVDLPGYREGRWWVQDAAAALPARLLGARRGKQVIDLCAAPGGKTLQLSATGAQVTAVDLSARRMEHVDANLRRARLNGTLVAADALEWRPEALADAILLDAPCSATGTIRRHPELPYVKSGDGIDELVALQDKLLDAAWEMLKPGGQLVFCTCSLFRAEGEDRLAAALERLPGVEFSPIADDALGDPALVRDGVLRCLPHLWSARGGLDGFFAFRVTKAA